MSLAAYGWVTRANLRQDIGQPAAYWFDLIWAVTSIDSAGNVVQPIEGSNIFNIFIPIATDPKHFKDYFLSAIIADAVNHGVVLQEKDILLLGLEVL